MGRVTGQLKLARLRHYRAGAMSDKASGAPSEVSKALAPTQINPLVAIFLAKGIRILGTVDEPLFCASDVAAHIEDANATQAFRKDMAMSDIYVQSGILHNTKGEARRALFLTESGLYRYLLRSKKKLAEPFQLYTYDILTTERKRVVDETLLALKIERTRCATLKREAAITQINCRAERINQYDFMRATNIARDELRTVEAQLKELNTPGPELAEDAINSKGAGGKKKKSTSKKGEEYPTMSEEDIRRDEEAHQKDVAAREANTIVQLHKVEHEAVRDTAEESISEDILADLFLTRDIRVLGTVCEPLLCAADLARRIKDAHSDRIFREQTPEIYIRWEMVQDTQGQLRRTRFLTEAGAYRYLLQSPLEDAEPFQLFTYSLLKTERKRILDDAQLALKIAQTRAEDLQREKAAARKEHKIVRIELNNYIRCANIARDTLRGAKSKLRATQDKKARMSEAEQIRHYWSPFTPPK